jgi:hypothetical protein
MATARAILRGVGRSHGDKLSTGPCCLVREKVRELPPRRSMDALSATMGMDQAIDRQIFARDRVKLIDDATAVLLREITAAPGAAFMDARAPMPVFGALWRPLLPLAVRTLDLGEGLFLTTEESLLSNFLTRRAGGESLHPDINAHPLPCRWHGRRCGALTREADRPRARAAAADRRRLGRACQWAMQDDLDFTNPIQPHPPLSSVQLAAHGTVGRGGARIASLPAQTWIARRLSPSYAAKECWAGQVNAYRHVLQHLRLNASHRRPGGFERGQGRLLIGEPQRFLPLLPRIPPFGEQVIVEPATLLQLRIEEALLLLVRLQTVRERLTHALIIYLKRARAQTRWPIHPLAKAAGLSGPFL